MDSSTRVADHDLAEAHTRIMNGDPVQKVRLFLLARGASENEVVRAIAAHLGEREALIRESGWKRLRVAGPLAVSPGLYNLITSVTGHWNANVFLFAMAACVYGIAKSAHAIRMVTRPHSIAGPVYTIIA